MWLTLEITWFNCVTIVFIACLSSPNSSLRSTSICTLKSPKESCFAITTVSSSGTVMLRVMAKEIMIPKKIAKLPTIIITAITSETPSTIIPILLEACSLPYCLSAWALSPMFAATTSNSSMIRFPASIPSLM